VSAPGFKRTASGLVFILIVCVGLSACGMSRSDQRRPALGIPRALLVEARPIGRGARFHPRPLGPIAGSCTERLGSRSQVHLEVFAANRVVIVPAGIGVRSPRGSPSARIVGARCYGALVTLEPTGVVLVRSGVAATLSEVFHAWGQALSSRRVASFSSRAQGEVKVFVGGRLWPGSPGGVPLTPQAEIVVEIGTYVPPHSFYRFPPLP
jgi:hypothetical protein